ncbi:zinc-dependent metalloprotease [Actinacidiphila acidipaludis]|uniref:Zinc-dependent metalloprotease n=1 Tax=Actinacidiphila acidipaludis TaxID=2873382 RepID=A0ABS7Q7I3_9ACTN|nr:zinc-dependent metalloprotease [Streptomyces acidipaludis]MBY8878898.1 zinc-dependent metalloprotease [Streptomyces acidipaludis]
MTSIGASEMVDWNLAVATAQRLTRPGPDVSREEARQIVAELRSHAQDSEAHVRAFTRMYGEGDLDADGRPTPHGTPVLIVDRPGWVKANVAGFREILKPLLGKMQARRPGGAGGAVLGTVGGKVTGVEVGMLLSFLSSRVLGQYETFAPASRDMPAGPVKPAPGTSKAGRLLLVAPNIVHVERELDVDPHDFRLWVCLHEETHRTQFSAVPWLRDHIEGEIQGFLGETDLDASAVVGRVREAVQSFTGSPSAEDEPHDDGRSLVDLVQTPTQREILGRITAVMSLLEGHADFVMDGVGPEVVPTVAEIREKFTQRRASGAGRLDQALRRLLGLDAKLRQYRDGERFVRAVVEETGMEGFNRVWTSPNTLPTKAEIAKPAEWISRVHGRGDG